MTTVNDWVGRPVSELIMRSFAFASVLLAIVVPLLLDFGYGLLDVEVWFWSAGACCLAVVLGGIEHRSVRLGAMILALLFYVVADLYFIQSDILGLVVALAFLAVALSPAYETFRIVAAVFSLMFIATSMFSSEGRLFQNNDGSARAVDEKPQSDNGPGLRPIVHIVLDEFASLSRMAAASPLNELNGEIEADYLKRGFAIFPATRATSGSSAISLSELVGSPGQRYVNEKILESKRKGVMFQVPRNAYFEKLKREGYRISVVQSSHLDFCGKEVSGCLTYKRAEFIDAAGRYSKPIVERLRAAGMVMHARAAAVSGERRVALYSYGIQGVGGIDASVAGTRSGGDEKIWSPSGMSLRVFDHLEAHFVSPKPGDAYFIHLLLPHFPFVLDRNCKLRPATEWRWPLWSPDAARRGKALNEIYVAYGEQLRCTHARMMRLIDAMVNSQFGGQIDFIVHGDHGVRVHSKIGHIGSSRASEAALADGLDTFFAAKAPDLPVGINGEMQLLPQRFQEVVDRNILSATKH